MECGSRDQNFSLLTLAHDLKNMTDDGLSLCHLVFGVILLGTEAKGHFYFGPRKGKHHNSPNKWGSLSYSFTHKSIYPFFHPS